MRLKVQFPAFPIFLSLLFVGMSASGAHAYLDAGTGSMILQLLLGGVAGLMLAGKLYWYRLRTFLGFKPQSDTPETKTPQLPETRARADR